MIVSQCPISGIALAIEAFNGKLISRAVHPICAVPLAQLNAQEVTDKAGDNYLLFCGYMATLAMDEIVIFRRHLVPSLFTPRWLEQNTRAVARLANWLALNKGSKIVNKIPRFAVTGEVTATDLTNWLRDCNETIENLSIAWTGSAAAVNALAANFGHDWRDVPEDSLPKVGEAITLRGYSKYIHRSFAERALVEPQQYQSILRTVLAPRDANYNTLTYVRAMVMDYGLEASAADATDKELIVAALDKALIAKAGNVSAIMSRVESEGTEDKFRILPDSPGIDTPAEQPKAEDYPNSAAYIVALAKWKRAGKPTV
jgi:hypothetical protein